MVKSLQAQRVHTSSVSVYVRNIKKFMGILKNLNIVNLNLLWEGRQGHTRSTRRFIYYIPVSPPTRGICNRALFSIIQPVWSKKCDGCSLAPCWHTKSQLWMLVTWKAAFLENYSAVCTWILNGSSIECRKKKCQPFSLFGVQFGSQVISG